MGKTEKTDYHTNTDKQTAALFVSFESHLAISAWTSAYPHFDDLPSDDFATRRLQREHGLNWPPIHST